MPLQHDSLALLCLPASISLVELSLAVFKYGDDVPYACSMRCSILHEFKKIRRR